MSGSIDSNYTSCMIAKEHPIPIVGIKDLRLTQAAKPTAKPLLNKPERSFRSRGGGGWCLLHDLLMCQRERVRG